MQLPFFTVHWMTSDVIFIFLFPETSICYITFYPSHITFLKIFFTFSPPGIISTTGTFFVWTSLQCYFIFSLASVSLSRFVLFHYVWIRFILPKPGSNVEREESSHAPGIARIGSKTNSGLSILCAHSALWLLLWHLSYLLAGYAGCAVTGVAQRVLCEQVGFGSSADNSHPWAVRTPQASSVVRWDSPSHHSSVPSFVKLL